MLRFDETHNGQEIPLKVGECVELRLAENPTAGYRWHAQSLGAPAVRLTEGDFEAGAIRPGAGGHHRWRFEAMQAGVGAIEFVYRRSWETDAPAALTFAIRLRVAD